MSLQQRLQQEPEEILERLHRKTLPQAHKLKCIAVPWDRYWRPFLWLTLALVPLCYIGLSAHELLPSPLDALFWLLLYGGAILWLAMAALSFPLWLCVGFYNLPRERRHDPILQELNSVVDLCTTTESVPILLDFLTWLEPSAKPFFLRPLHAALVRLLPRVGDDHLNVLLTPPRRRALRRACVELYDTELARVALLCLASVRDVPTVKIARHLKKRSPGLQNAAEAFLDSVDPTPRHDSLP